ncbi:MAG: lipoyl(octanoyl) transferase LipB [Leptospiraceae bacterium]|nr:lipoyl(octanoyl) transferase LipB [Leptospiraceae bacterium]
MDCFILQKPLAYNKYINFQTNIRSKRKECILILEHYPTITSGINHKPENLLVSEEILQKKGISLFSISRGGDYTAHEPGQIVIYPHIDLKKRNLNLVSFIKIFRNSIIKSCLSIWNLRLIENKNKPGLYLHSEPEKKLVSFGVYFKSFFTSFGAALNSANSLDTFSHINPCGDNFKNITSIERLNLDISKEEDFKHLFLDTFISDLNKNSRK